MMPILVCLQKKSYDLQTIKGKRNFSSRTPDVFLKSQLFSKYTLNLARFDAKICRGSTNFAFDLMAGKFGKFGLKAPLYPVLSLSVSQKRQLTMKVRGCSRDDKPVFIDEIQAGNQKVSPSI